MGFERKSTVNKRSNMEYENLTEGEHESRLIYVADLGLQMDNYNKDKEPTIKQQIALCFEVLGSTVKFDGVEKPRIIWSKPFNIFNTMNGMSTEYAHYRAFVPTAKEDTVADWESVLGKPVNIIIKHAKKGANTYDNIEAVSPIPAKYQANVPEAITTDFSIAGSEDEDSPAIKNLFGIPLLLHGNRIMNNTSDDKPVAQSVSEHEEFEMNESVPF
jgi:hypothetical protein